jgi:AcrR family transcriptional regulator
MKTSAAQKTARKPRADAQRNRERILEVAKLVFTRRGAEASMDEIAKRAKVGPGTLYRHFPSRDDLLAAVYISEVEKLAEAQRKFSAEFPPIEALRAWMLIFIDYIAAKRIIAPALNAMAGGPSQVYQHTTRVSWKKLPMRWRVVPSKAEIFVMMSIRWTCCAPYMGSPARAAQMIGPRRRCVSWIFSFSGPDLDELPLLLSGVTWEGLEGKRHRGNPPHWQS